VTVTANPSGKRADGSHWQSDKLWCVRGHDIRPTIDGQPNPNVRRHIKTGTRQCVTCSRLRSRLTVRLRTALEWWQTHLGECAQCRQREDTEGKTRLRYCDQGTRLRLVLFERLQAMEAEGFDASALVGL
jgi:hypothetical protein